MGIVGLGIHGGGGDGKQKTLPGSRAGSGGFRELSGYDLLKIRFFRVVESFNNR